VKKLETATNSVVLVVALLAGYILVKQYLLPAPAPKTAPIASVQGREPLKGQKVNLSGVNWSPTRPTLVMALATYCHFCIDSTSFYQKLTAQHRAHPNSANLVAVFPQDTGEGRKFAATYHLKPDQILSSPLDALGVAGTPTLLLVGTDGTVKREWIGRLSPQQEQTVIDSLGE
jgi:hypothetical protein